MILGVRRCAEAGFASPGSFNTPTKIGKSNSFISINIVL